MALDKKFENLFLKVSTQAAIASNNFVGKKNKEKMKIIFKKKFYRRKICKGHAAFYVD